MFQHQSLGIKVNIQVTKLVLLRQRPVSVRQHGYRKRVWSLGFLWLLGAEEEPGVLLRPPSLAVQEAAAWPRPATRDAWGEADGRCYWVHATSASRGTLSSGPLSPLLHSPVSPGCRVDVCDHG